MTDGFERLRAALADRYQLERELGQGGMATVYLALDLKHQRKVAVKVLRAELAATLGPERFLREITIAANLQHPHILPLHDSGVADGFLYYVMPFVEGESLRQKVAREGELPVAEAVRILRDLADALAHAHKRGVVHRDIKPENVMLSERHALVTDFGVAKAVSEATGTHSLTTAGVALGTPAYMAPEQATADPHTDHRADIYAFGVVAYELLTGRPPFTGATPQAILAAHVTTAVEPVTRYRTSIPPALAALVMRCLEKKAADRPQSMAELVPVLETALTPSGGITPHETQRITGLARRSRWIGIAAAVAIVAAIGVLAWRTRGHRNTAKPAIERLAVIPFENRTGNPAQAELGTMAADWITRGLVDARLAEVVPTQVVAAAMGKASQGEAVAVAVARETGATKLVTGSYYAAGDSVRFQAELIDAVGNRSLAAIEPVTTVPSEAMAAIELLRQRTLGGLALAVSPFWGQNVGQSSVPSSLEGYRTYVQAYKVFWRDLSEAERLFRQVTSLDSSYQPGRLGLANTVIMLGWTDETRRSTVSRMVEADSLLRLVEARGAARLSSWDRRSLATLRSWLDANQDDTYRSWAQDSAFLGDGVERNQFASEALGLMRPHEALRIWSRVNPRSLEMSGVPYWNWVALAHHALGDHDAELTAIKQGLAQYPRSMFMVITQGRALAALGRWEELTRLVEEARNLPSEEQVGAKQSYGRLLSQISSELTAHGDTVHGRELANRAAAWYTAQPASARSLYRYEEAGALFQAGRLADAAEVIGKECPLNYEGLPCMGWTGVLAARRGDTALSIRLAGQIDRLELPRALQSEQDFWLGAIAVAQGDSDRAVELVRAVFSKRFGWTFLHANMLLLPLRDHPGFKELMRPKG